MDTSWPAFVAECGRTADKYPSWRAGQVLFNVLMDYRPQLAEDIRATKRDPFYSDMGDERLVTTAAWLREHWDD